MYKAVLRRIILVVMVLVIGSYGVVTAEDISPRYAYTGYIMAGLDFSGGRAISTGAVFPHAMRATSVEVRLQQYYENEWRTIGMWTDSSSSGLSEAGGSEEIDTGFEYRTYTVKWCK